MQINLPTLCTACGFENPPGMRFCGNCGTRLSRTTVAPDASPAPVPHNPSTEQLGELLGSDIRERFRQAGLESAGQRRSVTVLFIDLSGYTELSEQLDGEDLYELIQKFIRLLVEDVYKYEGMVDKILGDGLMALFGAPIAHENNAERAVRAAMEMQADVARLNEEVRGWLSSDLKVRIGLHAGTVIVGGVGSNLLMDYTAIGDTVNLASRLEEVAEPGTTLVSENVFRATRALFDYQKISSLSLKGISQPVTGYRLLGQKALPGPVRGLEGLHAPMVGREAELDRLKKAVLNLTEHKQGQFILVTGEAGIGKSRLTAEFKKQVDFASIRVLEGQSLTYRRSVSYWIFQELLRDFFEIRIDMAPAQVREQLALRTFQSLGAQAVETLPYLEYLLTLDHVDSVIPDRLAYLDAGQLRQQIFLAVRDLLVAEAQRLPLLLILEDLHWADEASLDLLGFIVDSVHRAPLVIYAISRPMQAGRLVEIADHAKKWLLDLFIEIPLQSLSFDQSERLLFELLAIPELPVELSQKILQRAAGIPFYLEEILRMLIDEQVIRLEAGNWGLVPGKDFKSLGVPENLQGLILARFDRLDSIQRKVLQSASVIGRQFSLPLLAAVMRPVEENYLREILGQLVEKAFLLPQASSQDLVFLFRHVLTSDAVYSTLLRKNRDRLHGQVGEALESMYADRLEGQIEVLASHFLRSPRLDKALHYLLLAGQRAARDYANQQARQHYEEALALLPRVSHSGEQAVQILEGLGDVLAFTGEYGTARDYYQQALTYSFTSLPAKERSALQRKIGTTLERQGDFDQALLYLAEAEKSLASRPFFLTEEKAQNLNDIGWIHFLRGNFEDAYRFLSAALDLVESSRKFDVIASIHNRLGAVAYQQRAYDQAVAHVRKSLALREKIGDMAGVARLFNNLGLLGLMRGNLEEAEANFVQSIERLERLGDAEGIALSYINLGLVQLDRGNYIGSEENLLRGSAAAEQIGHRFYLGLARMYLGRLRTAQGHTFEADQLLKASLRIFKELAAQDNLIDAACYLGENCFSQNDLAQALEWAKQAEAFMVSASGNEKNDSVQRGRVLRLFGAIARKDGDMERAQPLLQESEAIFSAAYERLEMARTAIERGLLSKAKKQYREAGEFFSQAGSIFRQLGADKDLQRAEELMQELL